MEPPGRQISSVAAQISMGSMPRQKLHHPLWPSLGSCISVSSSKSIGESDHKFAQIHGVLMEIYKGALRRLRWMRSFLLASLDNINCHVVKFKHTTHFASGRWISGVKMRGSAHPGLAVPNCENNTHGFPSCDSII